MINLFVGLHDRQCTLVMGQAITHQLCLCFSGLSIDFDTEQLYWISSGNSTINRCKLDGSGLEILEGVKGKLTKATALAIMGKLPEHTNCSHRYCICSNSLAVTQDNKTVLQVYLCAFKIWLPYVTMLGVLLMKSVEHPVFCCIL